MRFRSVVFVGTAAALIAGAGIAVAALPTARQVGNDVRVFDRTLACKTRSGFVRVFAQTGAALKPGESGFLDVNGDPASTALGVNKGLPIALVVAGDRGPDPNRGARVDMTNCARTTNRVPLTGKGLPTPVAFSVRAICPTGGKALVRLRYTYVPGAHSRDFLVGGRMVSAVLAVRSYRSLKSVAFAKLGAGGTKLQFSYAPACRTPN
jgi:hypothetical protein